MSTKKKPLDALLEIQDRFDQIRSTNGSLNENQILEIVAKATGQSLSIVKKRWKLMNGIEWQVVDYLERGIIGMNRAMMLVDNDLDIVERTEILNKSLDLGVSDVAFKEYLQKIMDKKVEA